MRSASQKDLDRLGLKVGQSGVIEPIEIVDPKTGVITKKMPGIDVGWDYNVGKAWLAPDVILGQQLMDLPTKLRKPALDWFDNSIFDAPYKQLVNSTAMQLAKGESTKQGLAQTVGYLNETTISYLSRNYEVPYGAALVAKDSEIFHLLRDSKKNRGSALPLSIATQLPSVIRNPDAILFDSSKSTLVYAQKLENGNYAKFVFGTNFKRQV